MGIASPMTTLTPVRRILSLESMLLSWREIMRHKNETILVGLFIILLGGWISSISLSEQKTIIYIPNSGQLPSPVDHIASSYSPGSSDSEILGFKSVFQNTSDSPIIAIGVTWNVIDPSGHKMRDSITHDKAFLGEVIGAYAPGSSFEVTGENTKLVTRQPITRIEVKIDFVETSDGKVWPDKNSDSYQTVSNMRRGSLQYRRYLVSEFDRGGMNRLQEIIAKEKARWAAERANR
jgi:hypothetical protein